MITDETLTLDSIFKGMKVTPDSDFGFIPNTLYFAMKPEGDFNLWLSGDTGDGTFYPASQAIPLSMTLEEAQAGEDEIGMLVSQEILNSLVYNPNGIMEGNEQGDHYLLVASDAGKSIDTTADVEIPLGVIPVGAVITVTNVDSAAIYIHPASGVNLKLSGVEHTGSCRVPPYSLATLYQEYENSWIVTGADNL